MYSIDGVEERRREILTELHTKNPGCRHLAVESLSNAPAGVSHLPVTQDQAYPQLKQQSHRLPRNYTGEMMSSLLVPAIALMLIGAPIEGTLLAYFVLSGGVGVLQTMGNVAYDIQNDIRMRASNGSGRFSIFSHGQNNLETPAVGTMHSPSRQ